MFSKKLFIIHPNKSEKWSKNLKKNDIIEITITDVSNDSNGVGRYENMAIFIPNAVTDDRLKVRVVKVLKNYAFGIRNH